jgi:hypothetical protein
MEICVVNRRLAGSGKTAPQLRFLGAGVSIYLMGVRHPSDASKLASEGLISGLSGGVWQASGSRSDVAIKTLFFFNSRVRSDSWLLHRGLTNRNRVQSSIIPRKVGATVIPS